MPSPLLIDTILYAIFEQLDVVSLARCMSVCRVFAVSAAAPLLWKRHVTERQDKRDNYININAGLNMVVLTKTTGNVDGTSGNYPLSGSAIGKRSMWCGFGAISRSNGSSRFLFESLANNIAE